MTNDHLIQTDEKSTEHFSYLLVVLRQAHPADGVIMSHFVINHKAMSSRGVLILQCINQANYLVEIIVGLNQTPSKHELGISFVERNSTRPAFSFELIST